MIRRLGTLWMLVSPVLIGAVVRDAWAQGLPTPGPGSPAGEGSPVVGPVIILGVALLGVLILTVAISDMRRKRRNQAVAIESQISDALMREPRLTGAVLTPIAHVPMTGGGVPTVEIRGEVDFPDLREIAVRVVRQELIRFHSEGRVEDRIFVSPPVPTSRR